MTKNEQAQALVTRTMRAAVKIGDDYYTVEETIALPPTASDEQVAQAVATGLRIYEAQRAAVDTQVRALRDQVVSHAAPLQIREPDAPASEKQRAYMDYLLKELEWDSERLAAFASERSLSVLTLTKREASELIDDLKGVLAGIDDAPEAEPVAEPSAAEQPAAPEAPVAQAATERQAILPIGERATPRQVRALERLVEERGVDLAVELRARFGERGLDELSMDEAGQLLSEWQQRPRQLRPREENGRRAA
jgi:hypothetical protein